MLCYHTKTLLIDLPKSTTKKSDHLQLSVLILKPEIHHPFQGNAFLVRNCAVIKGVDYTIVYAGYSNLTSKKLNQCWTITHVMEHKIFLCYL